MKIVNLFVSFVALCCVPCGLSGCNSPEESIINAAQKGDTKSLASLLKSGVDPNSHDEYGFRPLFQAVQDHHTSAVEILLKNGANPNAPLKSVNEFSQIPQVAPLLSSAFAGDTQITKLLLKYGANVNVTGKKGETALMTAVEQGHIECVRVLIRYKARLDIIAPEKGTALEMAKHSKDKQMISALAQATKKGR